MQKSKMLRWACSVLVGSCLFCPLARADENLHVVFRKLDRPEIIGFARKALRQWYRVHGDYKTVSFEKFLRTSVVYAELDIGSDGIPQRFLQIEDFDWCGSAGCWSFIYRRTPKGYEKICDTDLSETDPEWPNSGSDVMPQKENGYHLIDTGAAVIHWDDRQAFNSGQLCWEYDYREYGHEFWGEPPP